MISSAVASSDVPPGDVLLVARGAALSHSALVFGGICPLDL